MITVALGYSYEMLEQYGMVERANRIESFPKVKEELIARGFVRVDTNMG